MEANIANRRSKIYLTGFMGSGKSTVGPLVARRFGWPFRDLDDVIAEAAGCSIPALFEREGEAGFRRREAAALRSAGEAEAKEVIATGGGTLVGEENLRYAVESGFVVYLEASAAVLAERLEGTAGERPLLLGSGGERQAGGALRRHIEALLGARRSSYGRAHAVVDAASGTPDETAAAVAEAFADWRA